MSEFDDELRERHHLVEGAVEGTLDMFDEMGLADYYKV